MRTTTSHSLQALILVFLLPLALLATPNQASANDEQLTQATVPSQNLQVAEAHKSEGSKSKEYSHGSPHGMKSNPHAVSPHGESPHGKSEGSSSKLGYSKGYSHGSKHGYSKHGYGKKEGSHGKSGYGKHGYRGYGHGGHHRGHGSHGGHKGHGTDPFRHVLKFADTLGLTDAQISQIKDLKFEFEKERIMLKAQHEVAHMELDQMVHSGEVKESEMRAVADRISEIKSKKIHGMVDAKIALLKLMTDEQRKKISQMHSKH